MQNFLIALLIIYLLGLWQGRGFVSYAPYHSTGHGFGGGITVIIILLMLFWFYNTDILTMKKASMQGDRPTTEYEVKQDLDEVSSIDSVVHQKPKNNVQSYDEKEDDINEVELDTLPPQAVNEERTFYIIQTGAFREKENALRSLKELPGIPPVERWVCDEDAGWFKVRIGVFETEHAAKDFNLKLQRWGYEGGFVIPVTSAELSHFTA